MTITMNRTVPLSYLAIFLACAPSCSLRAQTAEEPKAKISISITEDGETKQMEREVPLNDPDALENALRELGIMQEFNIDGGANRIAPFHAAVDGGAGGYRHRS